MTTPAQVVLEARNWLLTPFKHQAMLKGIGVDCVGLIIGVGRSLGLMGEFDAHAPRYRGYGRLPHPTMLSNACDEFLDRTDDPGLGDILLMRFENDPQHFAIISDIMPERIIHAHASVGRVVEHTLESGGVPPVWRKRIVQSYRYRGVD